ncbi:MAG TPA: AraC family transcriptional regulator [Polyangiaceae bacterium]|nr:AraC family transcriptional regulator [Polyangiaceae bacterium]
MSAKVVDLRVTRALKALQAEPARRWTVKELAKLAGASRASLVRLFHASTGTSPKRWLTRYRLERAAELLSLGEQPLAHVAASVGYVSEFAFSRAFKRRYGVAPAHYRQQTSLTLRCAA